MAGRRYGRGGGENDGGGLRSSRTHLRRADVLLDTPPRSGPPQRHQGATHLAARTRRRLRLRRRLWPGGPRQGQLRHGHGCPGRAAPLRVARRGGGIAVGAGGGEGCDQAAAGAQAAVEVGPILTDGRAELRVCR
jgi:hypothetical protein